jgi:hypothetical protein
VKPSQVAYHVRILLQVTRHGVVQKRDARNFLALSIVACHCQCMGTARSVCWIAIALLSWARSEALAQRAPRVAAVQLPSHEQTWLLDLENRMIADITAGKPIVANIIAPLCEKTILACGSAKLGDGDSLETNLYWATTAGFGEWFGRRRGGWRNVATFTAAAATTGDADVLATLVYQRTMKSSAAWRQRGAPATFELVAVVHGWRGKAIDRALAAYARQSAGLDSSELQLREGHKIVEGGGAHIVAYSGHNRLMDVEEFAWPTPGKTPIGIIAVACLTADYMETSVPSPSRIPLLMTRDFLFANAGPVEAVILSMARGEGYPAMRAAAATAYAGVQETSVKRVFGAFTNPADRKWHAAK